MTKILDLFRRRRTERATTSAELYWRTVRELAPGTLTGRAAEAALAKLEELAAEIDKDDDVVEQDLQIAAELHAADAPAIQRERESMEGLFAAADKRIREAEAEIDRAQQALQDAQDARQPIVGRSAAASQRWLRVTQLQEQLAASGCPQTVVDDLTVRA